MAREDTPAQESGERFPQTPNPNFIRKICNFFLNQFICVYLYTGVLNWFKLSFKKPIQLN